MKRLLVVVDFQKDFVDGALGFPEAVPLRERVAAKIQEYQDRGDRIVYTIDTHQPNYLETQEGRCLPIPHCIQGTEGQGLDPSIESLYRPNVDKMIFKGTFGSTELMDWLREVNDFADNMDRPPFESIELVGLLSNICVIAECVIVRTACPEVPVYVDAQCTASNNPKMNEAAFDIMESLMITVTNRAASWPHSPNWNNRPNWQNRPKQNKHSNHPKHPKH